MKTIDKIIKENKLEILKDINEKEIREYDKNNNLIHYKDSDGYEYWKEYDKNNNLIHYKDSNGFERWKEYDKNNNLIYYKNSNGFEEWKEYDKNNNLIKTLKFENNKYYLNNEELIQK